MRIALISAALPPRVDGIGDHAACLARELSGRHEVCVLTGEPEPHPIAGAAVVPCFDPARPHSFGGLARAAAEFRPDWLVLQYNPFSFGPRGWCPTLAPAVSEGLSRCPGARLALMLHEPYVPLTSFRFAVMSLWQRRHLSALLARTDLLAAPVTAWLGRFGPRTPSGRALHLPAGSPLLGPVPREQSRARLRLREDEIAVGWFGTMHPTRLPGHFRAALQALADAERPLRVVYTGPDGEKVRALLPGVVVDARGPCPVEEVSERLSALDLYLAPFQDGVSCRRTSFLAALQHGLAVAATDGPLTDPLLREQSGRALALTPVRDRAAFAASVRQLAERPERRRALGEAAAALFAERFSWPVLAARLEEALAA